MPESYWNLLGELAPGDQRLAERKGGFYLYDHSGATPDRTDDGPLRMSLTRPVRVYANGCSLSVFVERDSSESRVMVTHAGMLRLRKLIAPLKLEIRATDEVQDLWDLLVAIR